MKNRKVTWWVLWACLRGPSTPLKSSYLAPRPPRCRGEGGMPRSTSPRPQAPESVPPPAQWQNIERTGEYPKSSCPAHHGRGPPSRRRGEGGMPRRIPHRKPPPPSMGRVCPLDPPCWPTSSPTAAKPSSELASTPILPNAHFSKVPSPSPSPMVSEPTGQQTCRSDTGPRPVIRLPPPSARRCRNN